MTADETMAATLTQTLAPNQEKTILGVNVPLYHAKQKHNEESVDSTVAIMQKYNNNEDEFKELWFNTKCKNQFDYAMILLALKKCDDANEVFNKLVEFDHLPILSNIVAHDVLDDFSTEFNKTIFLKIQGVEEFQETFNKYCNSKSSFGKILYFYFGLKFFKNNNKQLFKLSDELKKFLDSKYNEFTFPTAGQSNTKEINQLMSLVNIFIDKPAGKFFNLYDTITKYISISYHNILLMKIWTFIALQKGLFSEAKRTFHTYLNYINDNKIKNNGEYYDLLDVIQTYNYVLIKLSNHIKSNVESTELKKWFNEVSNIMNETVIKFIDTDTDVYLPCLKKILTFIYLSFALINENILRFENNEIIEKMEEIKKFLYKSIQCIESDLKLSDDTYSFIYYKYSYYLHKTFEHELALKYSKYAIKHSPDDVGYLNYHIKLLTGDENSIDKALLISQQTIENLTELAIEDDSSRWNINKKKNAIESYLIFLTLLAEENIEALPPFFGFVNKMFGNVPTKNNKNNSTKKMDHKNTGRDIYSTKINSDDTCTSTCTSNSSVRQKKKIFNSLRILSSSTNNNGSNNGNNNNNINNQHAVNSHNGHKATSSITTPINNMRKSLQVNRLTHKKNPSNQTAASATNDTSKRNNNVSEAEYDILRKMWLALSRLFQSNEDYEAAQECLEEYNSYADLTNQVDRVCSIARSGCVRISSGDIINGKKELLEALEIIESCGGMRLWACGLIPSSLNGASDNTYDEMSILGCAEVVCGLLAINDENDKNWRVEKAGNVLLNSVSLWDDGALRVLVGNSAELASDKAVEGWFGLKVLS